MSTEYDALNLGDMLEENDRLDSSGVNNDFLENFVRMPEKDGFVQLRLLPPAKGKKFFCATRTHRINDRSIHCPRELRRTRDGKMRWEDVDPRNPCPICKYYSDLWKKSEGKEGKEAEDIKNAARKIKPIERYYYNTIVRSQLNKNGELEKNVGPKIYSCGKTVHQKIVRAVVGDKENDEKPLGDISDPKTGRDFKIVKRMRGVGSSAYAAYDDSKFLDPSPLGDMDQVTTWIGGLHDLSSLRVIKPLEEIKVELKKHLGLIPKEDTNFDITEFQKAPSLDQQVAASVAKATETATAATDSAEEGKGLAGDEFFAELNNIN